MASKLTRTQIAQHSTKKASRARRQSLCVTRYRSHERTDISNGADYLDHMKEILDKINEMEQQDNDDHGSDTI
ncbi:uncharacterized protein LMH87_008237 [Akanthomyces muscarius]|uniref:Uncharacterized protein n=1 Tax=Akanthomyces muscarius TaxID=2231603 RepID=A0A9W8UPE7_AKAMU|nr:uncharacterized protein LMH87_008237 [Akanthomyces muscarius]KAJ4159332.1 hypothetical protein LMH87_008237 [Akanthomyces muscarius]